MGGNLEVDVPPALLTKSFWSLSWKGLRTLNNWVLVSFMRRLRYKEGGRGGP